MILLRAIRPILALALTLAASCSGMLPNSAVPEHLASPYGGPLEAATPLASVIRERELRSPDPSLRRPLLEQLHDQLAKSDPASTFKGITYDLTRGNALPRGWLVQTPGGWGRKSSQLPYYALDCADCDPDLLLPACRSDGDCTSGVCGTIARRKVCLGHSDSILAGIHEMIAGARRSVDIALLQPAPDTRFLGVLRHAVAELARSRRDVTVRLLVGQYPPANVDARRVFDELAPREMGRLVLSVAAMRSCLVFEGCDSYSWNHAKIVAVDGRDVLSGGHNLWSADYLVGNPVHDLSMRMRGPAAASAARYIEALWRYVCANLDRKPTISVVGSNVSGCVPSPRLRPSPAVGPLQVLAVARLGAGITRDFANQSELARDLALGAARGNIRIVQQDLGFNMGRADTLFPETALERLVDFLFHNDGDIHIVLSNYGAVGNTGSIYNNGVRLEVVARRLRELVSRRFEALDPLWRYQIRRGPDPVNAMLCQRVHLASFRFGPENQWPDGQQIANHAKFWMVDDRLFYIGSDNMYPVNLQEFGYIIDDRKAAQEIVEDYWTPLWHWSSRAAVSGRGVDRCIFREVLR